jgi:hypothetical protein
MLDKPVANALQIFGHGRVVNHPVLALKLLGDGVTQIHLLLGIKHVFSQLYGWDRSRRARFLSADRRRNKNNWRN